MAAAKRKFATYFYPETWFEDKGTENTMESLTDQSFRDMCEIDQLLLANRVTPRTPPLDRYDMNNYETADWTFEDWQNQKALVERKFLHLTPAAREYFKTPQEFFKYCSNPDNYELTKKGMVEKEVLETPVVIPETGDVKNPVNSKTE